MTTKNIKKGYEIFYKTKFTNRDDWTSESVVKSPRRWIASLAEKERGRCLVIGCGIVDLKVLQSDRKDIVGIDISEVALNTAKEFGKVILADGTQLPFRNSSFDLICAFDVLEHVPNKVKLMVEARRTLRNGGKIFLSVPIKIQGMKGDKRQPFDEPPTFDFLICLIKKMFHLSIIRGFYGRNPFNLVQNSVFTLSFFLPFFFKYLPYFLNGSIYISLSAIKSDR